MNCFGMRLIRRPWKRCLFWDVPFTIHDPLEGLQIWKLRKWRIKNRAVFFWAYTKQNFAERLRKLRPQPSAQPTSLIPSGFFSPPISSHPLAPTPSAAVRAVPCCCIVVALVALCFFVSIKISAIRRLRVVRRNGVVINIMDMDLSLGSCYIFKLLNYLTQVKSTWMFFHWSIDKSYGGSISVLLLW